MRNANANKRNSLNLVLLSLMLIAACNRSQDAASPKPDQLADARYYLSEGDLDRAHESVSQVLIEDPRNADALLLASRVELARGNRNTAKEMAESIAESEPEFAPATDIIVEILIQDRSFFCSGCSTTCGATRCQTLSSSGPDGLPRARSRSSSLSVRSVKETRLQASTW